MNKKAEKILTSTIAHFIRYGVKKSTMDDIADYAKVSKVTIYKYFVDKDTLYFEIAKYLFSHYKNRIHHIAESVDVLIKKLYDFMDTIGDFTMNGHFKLCEELSDYSSKIEAEYHRFIQSYERSLSALIDQGFSGGLFKDGLNKDTVFHYINMGIVYFQQCSEYRQFMNTDNRFRQQFMLFFISHIFIDAETILSA